MARPALRDFFPSIGVAKVRALFRTIGYPERTANLLAGLCTNAVPSTAWPRPSQDIDASMLSEARSIYARAHLPQGAPTSPALANFCAYRVDCRLSGLAASAKATYTRYADDLAFSGDETFARSAERFAIQAAAILIEEGFAVHHRKTRIMRNGVRQYLAGIVTNERLNVVREDFDRLKATQTNCIRYGPGSQNREIHPTFQSHLHGRVGFVESINPSKGARLRSIYQEIRWE